MNNAEGATPSRLFKIPKLAEIKANGTMSFQISKAPWDSGSKTGTSRLTLSRLKEEREATFPVQKKAAWRRVRKKRETRASDRVSVRKGEETRDAGSLVAPFVLVDGVFGFVKM